MLESLTVSDFEPRVGERFVVRSPSDGVTTWGQPVTIHVERFNRVLRLYDRLGFEAVADRGVYLLLRRDPA